VSITLTESWSDLTKYECQVPGNSVGQMYSQMYAGYAYVYQQKCYSEGVCGSYCDSSSGPNYSGGPQDGAVNYGCSTGCNNVACDDASDGQDYSVWSSSPANSC
jgi:hypothetical protein